MSTKALDVVEQFLVVYLPLGFLILTRHILLIALHAILHHHLVVSVSLSLIKPVVNTVHLVNQVLLSCPHLLILLMISPPVDLSVVHIGMVGLSMSDFILITSMHIYLMICCQLVISQSVV